MTDKIKETTDNFLLDNIQPTMLGILLVTLLFALLACVFSTLAYYKASATQESVAIAKGKNSETAKDFDSI